MTFRLFEIDIGPTVAVYAMLGLPFGLLVLSWVVSDYQEFMSLGPGGLPHNVLGYIVVTLFLRPLAISKRHAISTMEYPSHGASAEILDLPTRQGNRPVVKGIAPHRQMSQNSAESYREKINALFTDVVRQNPKFVELKKSLYEKHNAAIFVRENVDHIPEDASIARREIRHPHSDLSVHLYLSSADAKIAIEKGWAERHRLTTPRMAWQHIGMTYLLFYGPRDMAELSVLGVFVRQSVIYMTGSQDIHL